MTAALLCPALLTAILVAAPDPDFEADDLQPVDLPADVNFDGAVNYDDVIDHLFMWGPCEDAVCVGDLDLDGFVDVLDFIQLLDSLDQVLMVDARPA